MPIRALQTHPAGTETDCATVGGHGVQIPGDTAHITRNYSFASDAQLILVIEKDAIFQVGAPLIVVLMDSCVCQFQDLSAGWRLGCASIAGASSGCRIPHALPHP